MVERSPPWGASVTSISPPILAILTVPVSVLPSDPALTRSLPRPEYLQPDNPAGTAPAIRIREIALALQRVIALSPFRKPGVRLNALYEAHRRKVPGKVASGVNRSSLPAFSPRAH